MLDEVRGRREKLLGLVGFEGTLIVAVDVSGEGFYDWRRNCRPT